MLIREANIAWCRIGGAVRKEVSVGFGWWDLKDLIA
jgi:hypothetical protein